VFEMPEPFSGNTLMDAVQFHTDHLRVLETSVSILTMTEMVRPSSSGERLLAKSVQGTRK